MGSSKLTGARALKWSSLYRSPYLATLVPPSSTRWEPTSSAGTSGSNGDLATNGAAPDAVSGVASFNGVDDRLVSMCALAQLLGSGVGTVAGCIAIDNYSNAPNVDPQQEAGVFKNAAQVALIGMSATTDGLTAYVYLPDSSNPGVLVKHSVNFAPSELPAAGTFMAYRFRLNGLVLGLTINNGVEKTVALPSAFSPPAQSLALGPAYLKMEVRDHGTMLVSMSDSSWTSYGKDLQTTYGLALGF